MGLNIVRVRAMPNVVVATGAPLCVCVCVCDCKNHVSVAPVSTEAVFRDPQKFGLKQEYLAFSMI